MRRGTIQRGEIWDVQFPLIARENSEPYGHGPVLIVSADEYNRSAIRTVLAAVITSNVKLARAPGNVLVLAGEGNDLQTDSVINVSQLLVLDKSRLLGVRGRLGAIDTELLNAGLKQVMALS